MIPEHLELSVMAIKFTDVGEGGGVGYIVVMDLSPVLYGLTEQRILDNLLGE